MNDNMDKLASSFDEDLNEPSLIDQMHQIPEFTAEVIGEILLDKSDLLLAIPRELDSGMDELAAGIDRLLGISDFDSDKFFDSLQALVDADFSTQVKNAKERSRKAVLQRGKVKVCDQDTNEIEDVSVPRHLREDIASDISSLDIESRSVSRSAVNDLEALVDMFTLALDRVFQKAYSLADTAPSPDDIIAGKYDDIVAVPEVIGDYNSGFLLHILSDGNTLRRIRRKALDLVKTLNEFSDNPEQTTSRWLYEVVKDRIAAESQEWIDQCLLTGMTDICYAKDPATFKEPKSGTYSDRSTDGTESSKPTKRKRQLKAFGVDIREAVEGATGRSGHVERTSGCIKASLPWINDGQPTELNVEVLNGVGGSISVVHAIDPALSDVAEKVLSKEEVRNKVDMAIDSRARVFMNGIMPWEANVSGVRFVAKGSRAPAEYADESIWYTFDKRPNAPRVYFLLKSAKDIDMEASDFAEVTQDDLCMVILAITDKKNQLSVLQRLTGKSRPVLKSEKAGSI